MMNRIGLGIVAAAVFSALQPSVVQAKLLDFNFTVDVVSGPLAGGQYVGNTSVDVGSGLLKESMDRSLSSVAIWFEMGGVEFTEIQDVQDVDAQSPRANFRDGEFIGTTYIVSRFGNNPTDIPPIAGVDVDGFAIDNSQFGYVVGANFYQGTVNYRLPPEISTQPIQSVPESSSWLGLAIAGCYWLVRRNN